MNRIILIGNGFDLAHNLLTSYKDFINWYWEERVKGFAGNLTHISEDILCSFKSLGDDVWNVYAHYGLRLGLGKTGSEIIDYINNNKTYFETNYSSFFSNILSSIETFGWVDVENEYYKLLKLYTIKHLDVDVSNLNEQLQHLRILLTRYLRIENNKKVEIKEILRKRIYEPINPKDVSIEATNSFYDNINTWLNTDPKRWDYKLNDYGYSRTQIQDFIYDVDEYKKDSNKSKIAPALFRLPDKIMFLDFNYTQTASNYIKDRQIFIHNQIHGQLEHPETIIFGYGDEMDEQFKQIQNLNKQEYLKNIKSINYMNSSNYRKVLEFIESDLFQIYIMGHSCGNSDRTLLNTLFEHKNCISIKPFYHIEDDGSDNYIELIQNISRNFTDMKLMRDRVVNKNYCETIA